MSSDPGINLFVSVLIPAKNEEQYISECLKSILAQNYPEDHYEIIVMDNGSTDNTVKISQKLGVKVVDASELLIGGVRNLGAKHASGDIYAFIDADCIAGADWIGNGVALLSSWGDIGAVGGNCTLRHGARWVEYAWVLNPQRSKTTFTDILATGSFFIVKENFEAVGGFNPNVKAGEDTEISRELIKLGKNLKYSSDISVVHLGYPKTIRGFYHRQVWQASDYLKTKKRGFDSVFFLTHVFLISFVLSFASIFISIAVSMFLFSVGLLCALVLSIHRYNKSDAKFTVPLFLKVLVLNYMYIFARSIGLVKSYKGEALRILKGRAES